MEPKKSLGQHWLHDLPSLNAMCEAIDVTSSDTILEIGPGLGTLTSELLAYGPEVIAVEFDDALAATLPKTIKSDRLRVEHQDILSFDLTTLPVGYKIAANIPYYLTSKLLRVLCESTNPFSVAALLMQKEVAERVCAPAGKTSLLSISVQYYCEAALDIVVPAELFTPPPKVDSQILVLKYRQKPLFPDTDEKLFFHLVKAGFSQRRKTLLNALSGGLQLNRAQTTDLLMSAHIDSGARAQSLSLEQWHQLYLAYAHN